jgi:AmmeMemoRadiSam system protein B
MRENTMTSNRRAAVAGQFYSSNPSELRTTIESFVCKPQSILEAKAVVVPHAGYVYSGSVAGEVFSAVSLPHRIILLGPNHSGRGSALALSPAGEWYTPLGTVRIDADMNQSLREGCPGLKEDSSAHQNEHSLEVQLPFLQVLQPDFCFSAICVRTDDYAMLETLGHAMARSIRSLQEPVLMVASSDMTHYESAESASKQDKFAIDQILALDPEGLYQVVMKKNITMCGFATAVAVLIACRDMGASNGRLIRYTNSGVASGDYDHVVAYAGIAVI